MVPVLTHTTLRVCYRGGNKKPTSKSFRPPSRLNIQPRCFFLGGSDHPKKTVQFTKKIALLAINHSSYNTPFKSKRWKNYPIGVHRDITTEIYTYGNVLTVFYKNFVELVLFSVVGKVLESEESLLLQEPRVLIYMY